MRGKGTHTLSPSLENCHSAGYLTLLAPTTVVCATAAMKPSMWTASSLWSMEVSIQSLWEDNGSTLATMTNVHFDHVSIFEHRRRIRLEGRKMTYTIANGDARGKGNSYNGSKTDK